MAVNRKTLQLLRKLRRDIGEAVDRATASISEDWARAWADLTPGWQAGVADLTAAAAELGYWPRPWEQARIERLGTAKADTRQALRTLAASSNVDAFTALDAVVAATLAAEPLIISSQVPAAAQAAVAAATVARILPRPVQAVNARGQVQIVAANRPMLADTAQALARELLRPPPSSGERVRSGLLGRLRDAFGVGRTRAVNVTRTESLDVYRGVSRYIHNVNAELVSGWVWLTTLDGQACVACLAMHGTEHPLNEPGPLGHPPCRCLRCPIVHRWSRLGFHGTEPGSQLPDARAWFADQSEQQQLAIMGARRLALLRSRAITWDDLAVRRTNPNWRTSYVPRPARDLEALALSRAA